MSKKLISIVTPTYNEIENIEELLDRVKKSIVGLDYDFEFIVIDNSSVDGTQEKLKELARKDSRIKVILNVRNFGHIRSPYYGILQSRGSAAIYLASDLQDPPEIIPEFIAQWEGGYKLVMAIKPFSQSSRLMHFFRKVYYRFLDAISEVEIIKDSTGFGLYDKEVLDQLREINDPYPFLRGLICELGYTVKTLPFVQPRRSRGITKNNFYSLFDIAMLGVVSHSKVPIRIAAFSGILMGFLSIVTAFIFLILKLVFWNSFPLGSAPIVITLFFLFGVQLFFMGILGEYISSIHSYVQKRPVVVEKERINFEIK
ncbi:dolichol monophosphate mannose synthase [Polynucleobacter sp. QLW-P1DATA-2]|uniref:glycosyltransferase family 2 protein n=1 Tax=Polynucleobacter sp. QLW-P1DATA-2 TaxID=1743167 RepID=UPI0008F86D4C|nr:glycosyltransferase family 2 protein [Polynucleobacter sp. QLW-P1DATA-2]OIN00905.1 dolichol monophosphate mannose synthase [Polynucleobacter sp. QLW-P1DATA-2]